MSSIPTGYGVVFVTTPEQLDGERIVEELIQSRLAACVTLTEVKSMYRWEGYIQFGTEWQLMIKTDLAHFAELEAIIKEMHPYDVPEIIALPIVAGSEAYLNWIGENVG